MEQQNPTRSGNNRMQTMPDGYPPQAYADDEIDLLELWQAIMKRKWLVAGLAIGLAVLAAGYSLMLPNKFKADVIMVSAQAPSPGSGLAAQYGGLASLAGISLPSGDSDTKEALSVLRSRQFLSDFIRQHNLKPVLFADNWDTQKQQWIEERGFDLRTFLRGGESTGLDYEGMEELAPGEPSMLKAVQIFREAMGVSQDKDGIITLSIEWLNPVQSRDWANQLVYELNERLRKESIARSQRTIAYLENQIAQIDLLELRQITFKLIEENVKNMTLANTRQDYAFKVIDPAVVPELKSSPNRKLIVAVALVLGFMLGIFIALVMNWRENFAKAEG